MPKSPLVGTAYTARSKNLNNQRCVNLYVESVETKDGSAPAALLPCPGLVPGFMLAGAGPVRAMVPALGSLWAIAANGCYQITANLTVTFLGNIGTMSGFAQILTNAVVPNSQVAFIDATGIWVWNGLAFAPVTVPWGGQIGSACAIDTLGLVSIVGTYDLYQSNANDFTTWQALNLTTEDGNSDFIVGTLATRDNVIVIKERSTCFYTNAGLNGFVFQRIPSIYPAKGCIAPLSVALMGDVGLWLGQNQDGDVKVYACPGYEPQEVSTYAIENEIASYTVISDAVGFTYGQGGHEFYVLTFPTAGKTWCLDLKETRKLGVGAWHERAGFANGVLTRYDGLCAAGFNGAIYMGSAFSNNVWALSLTNYQDNGQPRKWARSWLATGPAAFDAQKCNYLDIKMDSGVDVPPGTNPQLVLRQSFDGGQNWSSERFMSPGLTGQTMNDVRFNRLGATRRGLNSERTFELSSTDNFKPGLIGAVIG